jgi:hypothetical protein
VHARSQQTPSTQKVDAHSEPDLQGAPFVDGSEKIAAKLVLVVRARPSARRTAPSVHRLLIGASPTRVTVSATGS